MVEPSYLLITGDFVKTGGMDRANYALADYMSRQQLKVQLVAHRVAPELTERPNVQFYQVPKLYNSYWLSNPLLRQNAYAKAQQLSQNGTRVIANGGNCNWGDINWVHYVHAAYQPEFLAGLFNQLKGRLSYQTFRVQEQQALQLAQCIIANSQRTKQDLVEYLGLPADKIFVIYYGTDPDSFYPATTPERVNLRRKLGWNQERPIVIFIGALGDRRKGFDTLFNAWQQLCSEAAWDADLVVVGRGAELSYWKQKTQDCGLTARIHFLGFRSDVPDLLRASDCLVAPTRYEAYGLGVHEALCCGLPAIVSATAGVAERYPIQLSQLLLNEPNDLAQLVNCLQDWRINVTHFRNLIEPLSTQLRSYTWDDMAQTIVQTISESGKLQVYRDPSVMLPQPRGSI